MLLTHLCRLNHDRSAWTQAQALRRFCFNKATTHHKDMLQHGGPGAVGSLGEGTVVPVEVFLLRLS